MRPKRIILVRHGESEANVKVLTTNFDAFVRTAVFVVRAVLTLEVRHDLWIMVVLDILRRIRKAALAAGRSKDMYALSVVMNLLIARLIQLQYGHDEEMAKGVRHTAWLSLPGSEHTLERSIHE